MDIYLLTVIQEIDRPDGWLRVSLHRVDDLESLEYGKAVGNVSALLLGDSGYAPINPPEWIDALRPQVVLLSVSAADKDGLPSPETLALLQGYTLLRTDRNGWIELSTDGEQMWVEAAR